MKINSTQRDMTLKEGKFRLRSGSQHYREKNNAGVYENNRGYSTDYCGSFTGKSEAAATVMKKGGILTSTWFNKLLTCSKKHNVSTSALVALVLAGVLRPAMIMTLPGEKDKEDKIYASGHSMASAILGFIASVILTSPLDTAVENLFNNNGYLKTSNEDDGKLVTEKLKDNTEKPKVFSKKLTKIGRIEKSLEQRANLRDEAGKIINRKSRELFKAMNRHRDALNTLLKMIPDFIISVPRAILTIALIPPILKYVFGVEKKKAPEQQKENNNMQPQNTKMDFIDKPVFQEVINGLGKGGVN